jgi:hypothetical protein
MNRLGALQRRATYGVGAVLLLSGLAWAAAHYFPVLLGLDERGAASFNAALMKVHGAAAMIALTLLGTFLPRHIGAGWRMARNRATGTGVIAIAMLLAVTGYLLYYAGSDAVREAVSVVHLVLGIFLPAIVGVHVLRMVRVRLRHRRRALAARRRGGALQAAILES